MRATALGLALLAAGVLWAATPQPAAAQPAASHAAQSPQSTQEKSAKPEPQMKSPERFTLPDWKPNTMPADAVAYGAALAEKSPPSLKAWCQRFVDKEMPGKSIEPRAIMAAVDQQFPKNSDAARDAAIFLIYYLGYVMEAEGEKMVAAQIRQKDNDAYDILLRMQQKRDAEVNRVTNPPSIQEMVRSDEESRKAEEQLKEMAQSRKEKGRQLNEHRRRINAWLKVMSVVHPRMKGIEPEVLREFQ